MSVKPSPGLNLGPRKNQMLGFFLLPTELSHFTFLYLRLCIFFILEKLRCSLWIVIKCFNFKYYSWKGVDKFHVHICMIPESTYKGILPLNIHTSINTSGKEKLCCKIFYYNFSIFISIYKSKQWVLQYSQIAII